jgi:cell division protein FtsB
VDQRVMTFRMQLGKFLRQNAAAFLWTGMALLVVQDGFGTHGVLAMRRSQREAGEIRKEIQKLNDENRELQDRVKDLKSDPQAIEEIARKEMGLAKPGELIFKLSMKAAPAPSETGSSNKKIQTTEQPDDTQQ